MQLKNGIYATAKSYQISRSTLAVECFQRIGACSKLVAVVSALQAFIDFQFTALISSWKISILTRAAAIITILI